MLDDINKIKNSDFSAGKRAPRTWRWEESGQGVSWQLAPRDNGDLAGVQVTSSDAAASGLWKQSFRVKKDHYYRVEAVVTCACDGHDGGLVLSLTPLDGDGNPGPTVATAPLREATEHTLRTYYLTPDDARQIELRIGLQNASGFAAVHDVRVLPVMEPESKSHPWAVPPLPCAGPAPVKTRRVCLHTHRPDRPLVDMLTAILGQSAVTCVTGRGTAAAAKSADAVFLLEPKLPAGLRSLRAVKQLADRRIVFVSLAAMEQLSKEHLAVRKVKQVDDPLHARIAYANFITAGFALYDILPFAGRSDHSPRMTQRQFRTNKVFNQYLADHDFHVLLQSETDAEASSEKPIALVHETDGGAIIAIDVEPAEAVDSSLREPTLAGQLILSALGLHRPAMGQYVAAARTPKELLSHLRDTVERFPELSFSGGRAPTEPQPPYLITLGRDTETVGLPVIPRPVVLIRSGLGAADVDGIYGVLQWLKQMLRPAPFVSPYAKTLNSQMRIAWLPQSAPLPTWGGWAPQPREQYPIEIDFEPGSVAACIDLTTAARQAVTVRTQHNGRFYRRLRDALPPLAAQLIAGRHCYRANPAGASTTDHDDAAWRRDDLVVDVQCDAGAFDQPVHASADQAGAELVRIELPATGTAGEADSPWRTEWAMGLLELITGLLMGAVIVNRDALPLDLELPKAVAELLDRAVLRRINEPDTDLPVPAPRGQRWSLPAGHALIAIR